MFVVGLGLVGACAVERPAATGETGGAAGDGGAGGSDPSSEGAGGTTTDPTGTGGMGGGGAGGAVDVKLPTIPVGWDAIRQWARLPVLRLGTRTVMRSTFDRSGANEASDAAHFVRIEPGPLAIPVDVGGPGVMASFGADGWHGSPWHVRADGVDHPFSETTTTHPDAPTEPASLVPDSTFPAPIAVAWPATHGSDLSWAPVPFATSLSLGFERTHAASGEAVIHTFPLGADHLSQSLAQVDPAPPPDDVVSLVANAGVDQTPPGAAGSSGTFDLPAGTTVALTPLPVGPRVIRRLALHVSQDQLEALEGARLRITWDDDTTPAIDTPVPLFFGAGTLVNRDDAPWLVRSLVATIRFETTMAHLSAYLPMPYFATAKIELVGGATDVKQLAWTMRSVPLTEPARTVATLHATYHDHVKPEVGRDLVLLDTDTEGGPFCGTLVGTAFTFTDSANLGGLDGDPRMYFDDSETPQVQGTGTDAWAGGRGAWAGGKTNTLPFVGHPVGAPSLALAKSARDAIHSAYRFLVADAMPFGRRARVQLEHGGIDESTERFRTLALWYGKRGECLKKTDALHVGDATDEAMHAYSSPTAGDPVSITSRYEGGVDTVAGVEIVPTTTDTGRRMTGVTEMSLAIDPDNQGVLLRRKLDYSIPDQRAEVWISREEEGGAGGAGGGSGGAGSGGADAGASGAAGASGIGGGGAGAGGAGGSAGAAGAPLFVHVGTWTTPGSNRTVYANATTETGAAQLVAQTSNRRFRDDELLIARPFTRGASRLRVKIVTTSDPQPLFPGDPPAIGAWSELRYTAYSWLLPP